MKGMNTNMTKPQLPCCPFCRHKIHYSEALFLKNEGEYVCRHCQKVSNILIDRSIYGLASGVCILALLILVLYLFLGDHGNPVGIFLVLFPFVVFYACVPFFVRLK
ncbi:MAG: hypothetical protein ACI4M3_06480 [Acutalibacteraceae bacterium]